jgi:hypothetical protein
MQLGAIMANRDFSCLLCNTTYTRMTGDLIVPVYETCDWCLEELGEFSGDELQIEITRRLNANAQNLGDRYLGDEWAQSTAAYLANELKEHHGDTKENTEKL